jgi:hypothetical protein
VSRPLDSPATPASSGFTATTGRSASERRDRYSMPPVSAVGRLPLATLALPTQGRCFRRSPSHVPCKSRRPGSRRLYAGHHLASNAGSRQAPPEGLPRTPGFDAISRFSTPQQRTPTPDLPDRALLERLPGPHLTRSRRAFSLDAHHDSLQLTQLQGGLTPTPAGPTPEGQQASISRTAPPMSGSSYTIPPSTFVTHW